MPVVAAVDTGNAGAIASARAQLGVLLTNYAQVFTVGGDTCLYWTKPLAGSWYPNWGGTNVTSLHDSEGWFAARVLVELYRYDLQQGTNNAAYLQAIDGCSIGPGTSSGAEMSSTMCPLPLSPSARRSARPSCWITTSPSKTILSARAMPPWPSTSPATSPGAISRSGPWIPTAPMPP